MTRNTRLTGSFSAALLSVILLTTSPPLHAQTTSAADTSEAATHFQQGKDHYAAGRYAESYESYQQAWRLLQSYDIAGNLGNVEVKLGRYREAVEHLQFGLDHLPASITGDQREQVVGKMKELLAKAKSRVTIIRLAVSPDGAAISVDDKQAGTSPLAKPFVLDPGEHRIGISHPGYRSVEHTVAGAAGSDETVRIDLVAGSGGSADSGPSIPLIVAGGSVALVAIGVGAAFLGVSAGKGSDADSLRTNVANTPPGNCTSQAIATGGSQLQTLCNDLDATVDAQNTFKGAGIGLLVGGGAIGVATLVYAVWPRSSSEESANAASALPIVAPLVGPGFGGLSVAGSF